MQAHNDRALLNLQKRLERQFFEGSRLDACTKRWVVQVYESVASVAGDGLAVTATFDVLSALNAGLVVFVLVDICIDTLSPLQIFKSFAIQ